MGKRVLVSTAVAKTFGANLPTGVVDCPTAADYLAGLRGSIDSGRIRTATAERFVWDRQVSKLAGAIHAATENSLYAFPLANSPI